MLLSVKALRSAILCVADNRDVRTYLRGVYIDGNDIVATNGHIAFIETTTDNKYVTRFSAVIKSDLLNKFLKKVDKSSISVMATRVDDNYLKLDGFDNDGNPVSDIIEYSTFYVNYQSNFGIVENVVKSETTQIKVNLDYLGILAKINKIVKPKGSKHVMPILNFKGEYGMITATWGHSNNIRFYVMPMLN